jgi:hypothetical protein
VGGGCMQQCVTGLFVPCNGPFCALLNGPDSCPPLGLGFGPNPARNNFVSCCAWAVLFFFACFVLAHQAQPKCIALGAGDLVVHLPS